MNGERGDQPDHSRFTIHDSRLRARLRRPRRGAACWSLLALVTGGVALPVLLIPQSTKSGTRGGAADRGGVGARRTRPPRRQLLLDLRWVAARVRRQLVPRVDGVDAVDDVARARLPAAAAPLCAMASLRRIVVTSIRQTAFVAAGSDAWGYVSQAHMWATGTLRQPEPLMADLDGFLPREAMAPLAYRPGTGRRRNRAGHLARAADADGDVRDRRRAASRVRRRAAARGAGGLGDLSARPRS